MTLAPAPTIHVGDESQPVKAVVVVHAEAPAPATPTAAWLTLAEVAERLRISASKASRLVTSGALACRRVGARPQVHVDELARYEAAAGARRETSGRLDDGTARAARQAMRLVGVRR